MARSDKEPWPGDVCMKGWHAMRVDWCRKKEHNNPEEWGMWAERGSSPKDDERRSSSKNEGHGSSSKDGRLGLCCPYGKNFES